eukprot:NODE_2827_length_2138_cov_2.382894.p1 GENE.NODE_2827_length_2138_cov_2.382894~~NODE_2827_length_2138_cov_2.382894.p1  ORF type:complete len:665 (-),score=164.85 NODE_2827_length_2138_cov_2.382894:142-1872(-)
MQAPPDPIAAGGARALALLPTQEDARPTRLSSASVEPEGGTGLALAAATTKGEGGPTHLSETLSPTAAGATPVQASSHGAAVAQEREQIVPAQSLAGLDSAPAAPPPPSATVPPAPKAEPESAKTSADSSSSVAAASTTAPSEGSSDSHSEIDAPQVEPYVPGMKLQEIATRVEETACALRDEFDLTSEACRRLLIYFGQRVQDPAPLSLSNQVAAFLGVIDRFSVMLRSTLKEVIERQQRERAPSPLSHGGGGGARSRGWSGVSSTPHRRASVPSGLRFSESKTTNSCTWQGQLQFRRAVKAIVTSIVARVELRIEGGCKPGTSRRGLLSPPKKQALQSVRPRTPGRGWPKAIVAAEHSGADAPALSEEKRHSLTRTSSAPPAPASGGSAPLLAVPQLPRDRSSRSPHRQAAASQDGGDADATAAEAHIVLRKVSEVDEEMMARGGEVGGASILARRAGTAPTNQELAAAIEKKGFDEGRPPLPLPPRSAHAGREPELETTPAHSTASDAFCSAASGSDNDTASVRRRRWGSTSPGPCAYPRPDLPLPARPAVPRSAEGPIASRSPRRWSHVAES